MPMGQKSSFGGLTKILGIRGTNTNVKKIIWTNIGRETSVSKGDEGERD